ncbi:hypothetical protein PoB_005112100 [Plakobranchus ocellatus]|uniref:Uncharacterized protein n=1 Tax=Plakobranchus ocellatus TaxID=259542 RepID=A0AAV4BZS0_9GAST|nr:hypothetical protein PoB_005112100 [Plakobranchus ocellatus]
MQQATRFHSIEAILGLAARDGGRPGSSRISSDEKASVQACFTEVIGDAASQQFSGTDKAHPVQGWVMKKLDWGDCESSELMDQDKR